jgi:hypothetical protein
MTSTFEVVTLDGLSLNDGTVFGMAEVNLPPPPALVEWARSADSDGSLLAREPPHDNAEGTIKLWVAQQATPDLMLAKVALITDKLQEAQRNPGGIDLVWTPHDSTLSVTGKVLFGEITDMPITFADGWIGNAPTVTMKLVRLPFWEGTEVVSAATVTSSLPVITLEVTGVTGDVPAKIRCIITDAATQNRRLVRVGLESRYYPTSSPPALLIDSANLVVSGYAGTAGTRTGAYTANGVVISPALPLQPTAVCGLGNLTHVGSFRVFARLYHSASSGQTGATFVRLSWQEGSGPLRSNQYTTPPVTSGFSDIDLGIVTIPEAVLGTQRWVGQIEAYATTGIGGNEIIEVDYVYLMPVAEGYGVARAPYSYQAGVVSKADNFAGTATTTALDTKSLQLGGAWATSGTATDFVAVDAPAATDHTVFRSTASDAGSGRFSLASTTVYAATEVSVRVYHTAYAESALIARYVDSSNYLRASILNGGALWVRTYIAGTPTTIASLAVTEPIGEWFTLRLIVFATGVGYFTLLGAAGNTLAALPFSSSLLLTGGTLDDGKVGFLDLNTGTARTRYYDDFYAGTPSAEPIACNASQSIEFREDDMLREDSTGTYWGPPPLPRAGLRGLPPAGTRTRKVRLAVVARRNDVVFGADDQIADSTIVTVNYTPMFLNAPR